MQAGMARLSTGGLQKGRADVVPWPSCAQASNHRLRAGLFIFPAPWHPDTPPGPLTSFPLCVFSHFLLPFARVFLPLCLWSSVPNVLAVAYNFYLNILHAVWCSPLICPSFLPLQSHLSVIPQTTCTKKNHVTTGAGLVPSHPSEPQDRHSPTGPQREFLTGSHSSWFKDRPPSQVRPIRVFPRLFFLFGIRTVRKI